MCNHAPMQAGPEWKPDKGGSESRLVLTDHIMWADKQVGHNQ